MKKLIATAASALLLASTLPAALDVSVGYNSDYYFRGFQLADDFLDAGIEFSEGGFYAGAWTAQPLDTDYAKEYDLYIGYGMDVSEAVSLDFGVTTYIYSDDLDTTYEAYIGAAFDFGMPVAPAVYFYYDTELEIFTAEVSASYAMEIDEASSIEFSAAVGHARHSDFDWTYYVASAAYSYAISETLTATASVNYTDTDESFAAWDDGIWFTVGASFSF